MAHLLGRLMLLRYLSVEAADALDDLESLSTLMSFEKMRQAVEELCSKLAAEQPAIDGHSCFSLIHAEQTEVVLNRRVWIELFLEQELPRMRQILTDHQKSEPIARSNEFEGSVPALARELEDGIRNSAEHAGGIGIEVGVFVVMREMI